MTEATISLYGLNPMEIAQILQEAKDLGGILQPQQNDWSYTWKFADPKMGSRFYDYSIKLERTYEE